MNPLWVLIFIAMIESRGAYRDGPIAITEDFYSLALCDQAKQMILEELKAREEQGVLTRVVMLKCVHK